MTAGEAAAGPDHGGAWKYCPPNGIPQSPLAPPEQRDRSDVPAPAAIGSATSEPTLAPAGARAVLTEPTTVPSELWVQAAALLSAELDED
ncbi:hypothetical protein [Nocardia sp. bgisy118]|uniref:hypothetical protein n=1 Tax=Nocardia sp. bgisy118 TaxID=3413786 RepID=UPI003F4A39AC